ncbi:MAG: hypothetical protein WA817_12250, partial [Candidatus Acidiferrum sp.]
PDVSVVGCDKIDDLRSDLTAEIGRIPDEVPACSEEFARLFTGNLHNQSLIPVGPASTSCRIASSEIWGRLATFWRESL